MGRDGAAQHADICRHSWRPRRGARWLGRISNEALTRRFGKRRHALVSTPWSSTHHAYGWRHVFGFASDSCTAHTLCLQSTGRRCLYAHDSAPSCGRALEMHSMMHALLPSASMHARPPTCSAQPRGGFQVAQFLPTTSASHNELGVRSDQFEGRVRTTRKWA